MLSNVIDLILNIYPDLRPSFILQQREYKTDHYLHTLKHTN